MIPHKTGSLKCYTRSNVQTMLFFEKNAFEEKLSCVFPRMLAVTILTFYHFYMKVVNNQHTIRKVFSIRTIIFKNPIFENNVCTSF